MRYENLSYGEVGDLRITTNKDNDNDDDSLTLVSAMMVVVVRE
jgi:hypothetical protein